jgi:hypothetical protein
MLNPNNHALRQIIKRIRRKDIPIQLSNQLQLTI